MIRDLTLSLREMIMQASRDMPELAACQISFDRPSDSYNPAQPTISLFLHDIRENTELRSNEPDMRVIGGRSVVQRAPFRLACTYLVTAWPGNVTGDELALREQRLLSQVLMTFLRFPKLPPEFLMGALAGQDPPLPLITAQAEGLRNASEFWTALSNRMRPSLNVTATLSLRPAAPVTGPLVISSDIRLRHAGRVDAERFRIGGRVTTPAGEALSGVTASLLGTGLSAVTDANGRYVMPPVAAGAHTLRLQWGPDRQDVVVSVPASSQHAYDVTFIPPVTTKPSDQTPQTAM